MSSVGTWFFVQVYLRYVGVQEMSILCFDEGDAGHHPLPETKQVVDTVGRELPALQTNGDKKCSNPDLQHVRVAMGTLPYQKPVKIT